MSFRKRLRDLGIEIMVGILWLIALLTYAEKLKNVNFHWDWILFSAYTLVVFLYPIRFRYALRNSSFWITFAVLFLVHVVVFSLAFTKIHNPVLGYYGLLCPLEARAFILIIEKRFPKNATQRSDSVAPESG
jgi:hypothetical protein